MQNRRKLMFIAPLLVALVTLPAIAKEFRVNLRTSLAGSSFNGDVPKGHAQYEMEEGVRKLSVEVDNVNLPNGTHLDVFVSGVKFGVITLSGHGGTILRSTFAHQSVPNVNSNSTVTVKFGATRILHGAF